MKFNEYVSFLLEGGFKTPIDSKRPVKAPNAKNHGTSSRYLGNINSPSAYSGFKGDSLNPAMVTMNFRLPKKRSRIKR